MKLVIYFVFFSHAFCVFSSVVCRMAGMNEWCTDIISVYGVMRDEMTIIGRDKWNQFGYNSSAANHALNWFAEDDSKMNDLV